MASRPIFLGLNRTPYNKQKERKRFEPSKVPRTIPVFKTGAPKIHASPVDLVCTSLFLAHWSASGDSISKRSRVFGPYNLI
jgi:hypothetical protein